MAGTTARTENRSMVHPAWNPNYSRPGRPDSILLVWSVTWSDTFRTGDGFSIVTAGAFCPEWHCGLLTAGLSNPEECYRIIAF